MGLNKIFTVNFFYLLFLIMMIPLIMSEKSIIDIAYFLVITYYYIKLKLYDKKII